jgi:hypothetical protein
LFAPAAGDYSYCIRENPTNEIPTICRLDRQIDAAYNCELIDWNLHLTIYMKDYGPLFPKEYNFSVTSIVPLLSGIGWGVAAEGSAAINTLCSGGDVYLPLLQPYGACEASRYIIARILP